MHFAPNKTFKIVYKTHKTTGVAISKKNFQLLELPYSIPDFATSSDRNMSSGQETQSRTSPSSITT